MDWTTALYIYVAYPILDGHDHRSCYHFCLNSLSKTGQTLKYLSEISWVFSEKGRKTEKKKRKKKGLV